MSGPDRVRIALVGAGRMGSVHLQAMLSSELIEVAAVVDPVPAARARLRAQGLATHETVAQLLDAGAPEGVLIAAPSDRHAELVRELAEAGVSALCEKPIGIRAADAASAAQAARAAGTILQVGYWRRFVPELRALRERIAAGGLGEIYQLSCMQWDAEPPSEEFAAHSGGIAIDMGVHEFDQLRWLLGQEFGALSAVAGPVMFPGHEPPDFESAVILGRMSGGTAAVVSLGRRLPYADSVWIELWGTSGYERIPFMWDADVWAPGSSPVFLGSMRAQAEAFARALRGEQTDAAAGADAVAALTVAERAARALADSHASRGAGGAS
jgi:myo-inositol 2-dehydrogenase / D-chiro-inositol 1-dehydrogenase